MSSYLHTPTVERDAWYRVDTASGSDTPTTVYLHDGTTDPIGTSQGASGSTVRDTTRDDTARFWSATQVLYLKQLDFRGAPNGTVVTSTGVLAPAPAGPGPDINAFAQKWTPAAVSTTLTGTLAAWTIAAVDCTAGAGARTLPAANSVGAGTEFAAKKNDASANALTIGVTGSDVILGTGAGASTRTLAWPGESAILVSDGVSKFVVRSTDTPRAAASGTATLSSGAVTVSNTSITANSVIRVANKTVGGTPGALYISAKSAGTSFTITSTSGTDTSVVQYDVVTF